MKEVKGHEEENKKIQHISNWSQKRREGKEVIFAEIMLRIFQN